MGHQAVRSWILVLACCLAADGRRAALRGFGIAAVLLVVLGWLITRGSSGRGGPGPALGLYPTAQGLLIQAGLLAVIVGGFLYSDHAARRAA